jgi:hypothetical protein
MAASCTRAAEVRAFSTRVSYDAIPASARSAVTCTTEIAHHAGGAKTIAGPPAWWSVAV